MKRFWVMGILLLLLLGLANCEGLHGGSAETNNINLATEGFNTNESSSMNDEELSAALEGHLSDPQPIEDALEFVSLEALLETYQIVKAGKANSELAQLAESVNFATLFRFIVSECPCGFNRLNSFFASPRIA